MHELQGRLHEVFLIMNRTGLFILALGVVSGALGCQSHSRRPGAPEEGLRIHKQSPGPELPKGPRRPYVVCNYRATSGQCFDTAEEACAAMGCSEDDCGTLYGVSGSETEAYSTPPGGPLPLACN